MTLLEGLPISPGYSDGLAIVYDVEIERKLVVPDRDILSSQVDMELERLNEAVKKSHIELQLGQESSRPQTGQYDPAALLAAHALLVDEVAEKAKKHLCHKLVNIEQAIDFVIAEVVRHLQQLESIYLREREIDMRDVGRRLQKHLNGTGSWSSEPLPDHSVVVTSELLPSEAIELAKSGLKAIVVNHGGLFSHTAILARSLGIPAVSHVTTRIQSGTRLLVDGTTGTVIITPSSEDIVHFRKRKHDYLRSLKSTASSEKLPCITLDGTNVSLFANISRADEVKLVEQHNLSGTGLFRTEFLFLDSQESPCLNTQLKTYSQAAKATGELPLVIRTFDLGGDKLPTFLSTKPHPETALRGLRFSLAERSLLETQLRAIVLSAQEADVRILFPMVIGSDDLSHAIEMVNQTVEELGVIRCPPIGAMIETPAALFALEEILDLVDFVAIGTNDLTQYMLAADRDVAELTNDCSPSHPAVLRAIKQVVDCATEKQRPVSVCGEVAGNPDYACLLVGLGIRELSVSPQNAANVRHAIQGINCSKAQEIACKALGSRSATEVEKHLVELHESIIHTEYFRA